MATRHDPVRARLAAYPFTHTVQARFGDLDSYRHVNNVAVAAYYEDARVALNGQVFPDRSLPRSGAFHFLVAKVTIEYLGEVNYPGEYQVGVGVGTIGRTSVSYPCGLFLGETCLGLSEAVMVHMSGSGPTPFTPDGREALEKRRFPTGQSM